MSAARVSVRIGGRERTERAGLLVCLAVRLVSWLVLGDWPSWKNGGAVKISYEEMGRG